MVKRRSRVSKSSRLLGSAVKLLVEAHRLPTLMSLSTAEGWDALHPCDLPNQDQTCGGVINEVSLREERVVITKDTDF